MPQKQKNPDDPFDLGLRPVESPKQEESDDPYHLGLRPIPSTQSEIPVKKGFIQGVKDLPQEIFEQINEGGKAGAEHIRQGNYPAAFHDVAGFIVDPFTQAMQIGLHKIAGTSELSKPEVAKSTAASSIIGATGLPVKATQEAWQAGDYPRLGGQALTAAALFGLHKGYEGIKTGVAEARVNTDNSRFEGARPVGRGYSEGTRPPIGPSHQLDAGGPIIPSEPPPTSGGVSPSGGFINRLLREDEGTFTPDEMWSNLKRLLGRDPTPEEVERGLARQPEPHEQTGRVAPFIPPVTQSPITHEPSPAEMGSADPIKEKRRYNNRAVILNTTDLPSALENVQKWTDLEAMYRNGSDREEWAHARDMKELATKLAHTLRTYQEATATPPHLLHPDDPNYRAPGEGDMIDAEVRPDHNIGKIKNDIDYWNRMHENAINEGNVAGAARAYENIQALNQQLSRAEGRDAYGQIPSESLTPEIIRNLQRITNIGKPPSTFGNIPTTPQEKPADILPFRTQNRLEDISSQQDVDPNAGIDDEINRYLKGEDAHPLEMTDLSGQPQKKNIWSEALKRFIPEDEGIFDPDALWSNLRKMLGRNPNEQELIEGMKRQSEEPDERSSDRLPVKFAPQPTEDWTENQLQGAKGKWDVFDPTDGRTIQTFNNEQDAINFIGDRNHLDYAPHDRTQSLHPADIYGDKPAPQGPPPPTLSGGVFDKAVEYLNQVTDLDELNQMREHVLKAIDYLKRSGNKEELALNNRLLKQVEGRIAEGENADYYGQNDQTSGIFDKASELLNDGHVSQAHELIHKYADLLNKDGYTSEAEKLVNDWNKHMDDFFGDENAPTHMSIREQLAEQEFHEAPTPERAKEAARNASTEDLRTTYENIIEASDRAKAAGETKIYNDFENTLAHIENELMRRGEKITPRGTPLFSTGESNTESPQIPQGSSLIKSDPMALTDVETIQNMPPRQPTFELNHRVKEAQSLILKSMSRDLTKEEIRRFHLLADYIKNDPNISDEVKESFKFEKYQLPDGSTINVDATAAKGLPEMDFTTKEGKNIKIKRLMREFFGDETGAVPLDDIADMWNKLKRTTGWGQGKSRQNSEEQEEFNFVHELINLPDAATTTGDFSYPGRQGLPLITTKQFFEGLVKQFPASLSKKYYDAETAKLQQLPVFRRGTDANTGLPLPSIADKVNFKLKDVASGGKGPRAESGISKWLETGGMFGPEKIAGIINPARAAWFHTLGRPIRGSNRAFVLMDNILRAKTFQKLMDLNLDISLESLSGRGPMPGILGGPRIGGNSWGLKRNYTPEQAMEMNPYHNLVFAKELADFVNTAAGSAPLKVHVAPIRQAEVSLEKMAKGLSFLMFSPKLFFSRARLLSPSTYIMASPQVRKQYMKALISMGAAWFVFAELLKNYVGDEDTEINNNATNSDFGKVRIGNTRLDPGAGFLQFLVAYARMYQGGTTSSSSGQFHKFGEGYQAETQEDKAERFLVNKMKPAPKFIYDLAHASEGEPFHVGDRMMQLFIPLAWQDLYELSQENPEMLPKIAAPLMFGIGTQTYDKGESVGKFIDPENDWLVTGGGPRDLMPEWIQNITDPLIMGDWDK